MRAWVSIIGLCVLAAVLYGVLHDQITARVCIEYFTIGHPRLIDSDSPTVIGLFWGVVATWWVGLPLGIALAAAARLGKRPPLRISAVARLLAKLLVLTGVLATFAGFVGYVLAIKKVVYLVPWLAERVPRDSHAAFLACGFAHTASYAIGVLGGLVLAVVVWRERLRS